MIAPTVNLEDNSNIWYIWEKTVHYGISQSVYHNPNEGFSPENKNFSLKHEYLYCIQIHWVPEKLHNICLNSNTLKIANYWNRFEIMKNWTTFL